MREQLTPAASISRLRLSTADSQLFSCNSLSFTLLSKNAPANHLESHSCKNKGLKVPCFHTLTKKGVGEGVRPANAVIPSEPAIPAGDEGSQCSAGREPQSVNHKSPVTNHESLRLTPLDSALTSKRPPKSFTCNTYEKHTQGEGSLVAQASACVCRRSVGPGFPVRITSHESPVTVSMRYNLPRSTGAKENHR